MSQGHVVEPHSSPTPWMPFIATLLMGSLFDWLQTLPSKPVQNVHEYLWFKGGRYANRLNGHQLCRCGGEKRKLTLLWRHLVMDMLAKGAGILISGYGVLSL